MEGLTDETRLEVCLFSPPSVVETHTDTLKILMQPFETILKSFNHVTHFLCASTADLLVNTLCLPFTLVYTLQGEWKLGGTLCFLLPYAQGLAVHVSTVTLNVIALDRHR